MASPRTPANQRQRTWRAPAVRPEQTARRRNVFRVLVPLIGLCLLCVLAWLVYRWFNRPPKLDLIAFTVADYRNPEVPPIAYCYEDVEGLHKALDAEATKSSYWSDATSQEAELAATLRETSNSHDNVLVYIKAHGVTLSGDGYLLGGNFELSVPAVGRLSIAQLLSYVSESPARLKLLVLDTGHIESDPRMGMLTNEFTHALEQAVRGMPADENLWVLTSNSLFERAQVSHKDRRSAFGYYLAEGLNGKADGILARSDETKAADRLVQLDELYTYVREYVNQYARMTSDDHQSQTPRLLRSGQGEVTNPPHEVLLRIEELEESDEKEVALRTRPRRSTASHVPVATAVALFANQAPASGTATESPKEVAPAAAAAAAAEAKKEDPPKDAVDVAKDSKPVGDQVAPPAASDDSKAKAPDDSKAKSKEAPVAAPPPGPAFSKEQSPKGQPRKRTAVEQALFDYESWLQSLQNEEVKWRPVDGAPELARLYYESLAGCRERALAGHLFLNVPEYQLYLERKMSQLKTLQGAVDARLKVFESGAARPTYERDGSVRAAIRVRNEACHLLPMLIAHHALLSASTPPTMQSDLQGLIAATSELDRLLAQTPDQQNLDAAKGFEGWKQTLNAQGALARGHLEKLRADFRTRCDDQSRLIDNGGNATVARRAAELAQSPLATAQLREELQGQTRHEKAALGFAEVEKQGGLPLQMATSAEQQRLAQRGWQRVLERADLELALARILLDDQSDREVAEARQVLDSAKDAGEIEARLALVLKLDTILSGAYRRAPERLGEHLRSKNYAAWRAAETAIRLADARDQTKIGEIINDRKTRMWSDPIAGVPLAALPQQSTTYRLTVGAATGSAGETVPLNFGVAENLAVRFSSNSPLPERLRFRLTYDKQRLTVKDAQGAALASDAVRELVIKKPDGSATTEYRLDLQLEARDQLGGQTSLTLNWLDANPPRPAKVVLVHPQPVLSQLAVFGQRGTAKHTWRNTPEGESYFDVPFAEGVAHVTLMPFSGHETRYDFRLANIAKHPKKYQVVIYSIPGDVDARQKPAELAAAAVRRGKVIARNELAIEPGGIAPIRFDSPPPPAAKDAPAAAKTAPDTPNAAAKEPPPDVTAGLVCVLTEDIKPAAGKPPANPDRQTIVIEAETQLPQFYIRPTLNYINDEISAVLNVQDVNLLPDGGANVELELISDQRKVDPRARVSTQLMRNKLDGETLKAYVRADSPSRAKVFLHVDDYPRAFIYEFPLDANREDVERKVDLQEIALPDATEFPLYYDGIVPDPKPFPFKVDLPPLHDGSYAVRVFIDDSPDGEFDGRTRAQEWSNDRVHKVELIKKEEAPFLSLRSSTGNLVATLDLKPYRNQPVYVRVQIFRRLPGDQDVLAERSVKIFLDGEAPMISALRPTGDVIENTPFTVNIDAWDKVTDISQVEFALKKQANPDAKSSEKEVLVDPKPVPKAASGYQLMHMFEKAGAQPQSLFFQATDMRGNKSEIQAVAISVRPMPTIVDKGVQVPVAKLGQVAGRAALPDGARGDIKLVVLKDAGGKTVNQQPPAANGSFFFDKVLPGQYTVEAKGFIGGNESKPAPVNVNVEAGKRAGPVEVLLGR